MALKYYGPGEHGSGFVGFRVTVFFNRDYRQEYFSTLRAKTQDETDPVFRYEKLKAQIQEAEWQAKSLLHQYQVFVSEDHPSTKPHRGVGCHGITAGFSKDRRKEWQAVFRVKRKAGQPRAFTFRTRPFSQVWHDVVHFWAREHEILDEDRDRILANPPEPSQFKDLRRHLNSTTKADIPVDALSPVFAEQRGEIAREKALKHAKDLKLSEGLMTPPDEDIEADMADWFRSETAS